MKQLLLALLAAVSLTLMGQAQAQTTPPEKLAAYAFMSGAWLATTEAVDPATGEWTAQMPSYVTVDTDLGGAVYAMRGPLPYRGRYIAAISYFTYDSFNDVYRVALMGHRFGLLDVFEGQFAEGVLTASNAATGSASPDGAGGVYISRLRLEPTADGFQLLAELSHDDGASWSPIFRTRYTHD
tara:strand:+ start:25627 stop:26175 length:549 start_codon:yes stop_codon:yes gene_type:complete